MPGKCRPSLMPKTLANAMFSNLSTTDKECIKAVFEKYVPVVRCKECMFCEFDDSTETYMCRSMRGLYRHVEAEEFCSRGER